MKSLNSWQKRIKSRWIVLNRNVCFSSSNIFLNTKVCLKSTLSIFFWILEIVQRGGILLCSRRYIIWWNTKFVLCRLHEMYFHTPDLNMDSGFCLCKATPPFSCSTVTAWNQSSHWHLWLLWAAACSASQDIHWQVTTYEDFVVPFLHILSSQDKALIEKPI